MLYADNDSLEVDITAKGKLRKQSVLLNYLGPL